MSGARTAVDTCKQGTAGSLKGRSMQPSGLSAISYQLCYQPSVRLSLRALYRG
jgi:hypothetical protein